MLNSFFSNSLSEPPLDELDAFKRAIPQNNATQNNTPQSGGMTTGAEIATIIGFVIYIVACVLLPKTGEGKFWCIFWFIALLNASSSSSGGSESELLKKNLTKDEKNKIAKEIKDKILKFYNEYVKKNSYFKIGNIKEDSSINSNFNGDYFMKVEFSSKNFRTHVIIKEIVFVKRDVASRIEEEIKKISILLGEMLKKSCDFDNTKKSSNNNSIFKKMYKSAKRFKNKTKQKICMEIAERATKLLSEYKRA